MVAPDTPGGAPVESAKAREAFTAYLALGPQRSLAKLAAQWGKSRAYVGQLERWSAQHHWVERARVHDAEIAAEADERARAERLAEMERARKQRLQVARAARGKGVEAFALIQPAQLAEAPEKIVRMWQYADETERRDMGEPDKRVELIGKDGGAIHVRFSIDHPEANAGDA